jgi:ArsR family transcriptional regulator
MTSVAEQTVRTDRIFKALASNPRRDIVTILATAAGDDDGRCCGDEVCACTLSERLGLGAPTISHHMKTLIDAGLVIAEKRGLWVYYRLAPSAMADLSSAVAALTGTGQAEAGSGCACG